MPRKPIVMTAEQFGKVFRLLQGTEKTGEIHRRWIAVSGKPCKHCYISNLRNGRTSTGCVSNDLAERLGQVFNRSLDEVLELARQV